jgi:hypothetical protein
VIDIAAPGTIIKAAITREIRFIWARLRAPQLETHGTAEITYRVCPPDRHNGRDLELMPPHFNKIELTNLGLRDVPTFNFSLAILTSAQLYHVLLISQAIHYSSVFERIPVSAVEDKERFEGRLEISSGTPGRASQGWCGRLYSRNGEYLGLRKGGQFEYTNWQLIDKFQHLARPFTS